jgi:hypothetical protein
MALPLPVPECVVCGHPSVAVIDGDALCPPCVDKAETDAAMRDTECPKCEGGNGPDCYVCRPRPRGLMIEGGNG